MSTLRKAWTAHALGWVTFGIMVALYLTYFPTQYVEWISEQQAHGEPTPGPFSADYLNYYFNRMLEAISGESYQVWVTIMLTKWWIERNSAESRDSDDEIVARLKRIESRLGVAGENADAEVMEAAEAARYHKPWRWGLPLVIAVLILTALMIAPQALS